MSVTEVTILTTPTPILDKDDGRGMPPMLLNVGAAAIALTFDTDTDTYALEPGQLIQAKADQDVSGTVASGTEILQILEGIAPIGIGGTPGVDHAGFIAIGSGTPNKIASVAGDLFVSGQLEVDGTAFFDGTISANLQFLSFSWWGGGAVGGGITTSADDGFMILAGNGDGVSNNHVIVTSATNSGKDHDHDVFSSDPQTFIHSGLDPNTDHGEFLGWSYAGFVGGTMETDRAAFDLSLIASTAFAGATGANRNGGNLVLTGGAGSTAAFNGGVTVNAVATVTGGATLGSEILVLDQNDADQPFTDYQGTESANQTDNISTVQGAGSVVGPQAKSVAEAAWLFDSMIQIEINGATRWIPAYTADP